MIVLKNEWLEKGYEFDDSLEVAFLACKWRPNERERLDSAIDHLDDELLRGSGQAFHIAISKRGSRRISGAGGDSIRFARDKTSCGPDRSVRSIAAYRTDSRRTWPNDRPRRDGARPAPRRSRSCLWPRDHRNQVETLTGVAGKLPKKRAQQIGERRGGVYTLGSQVENGSSTDD